MKIQVFTQQDVQNLLPERKIDAHKGDFGKVLLLCGSEGYTGAAALAAMGALRSGSGLVYLGVPRCIYAIEAVKLTEVIVFPLDDANGKLSFRAMPLILERLPKMDAVLLGPGLGLSQDTEKVVLEVLNCYEGPVVLDADGINAVCAHKDILRGRTGPTIITPHMGEFQRLGGCVSGVREEDAVSFAKEYQVIVVLKGHGSIITDGDRVYRNPTGNPGMAVGGSGDVLAGMIVSLLGQGLMPLQAAACGAYLHGAAGDLCQKQLGQYGMLPSDMLDVLPRLLK